MDYELISRQLRELGHPLRLWISVYLLDHEKTYGVKLSKMLNKPQAEISQHLKKLKKVGILVSKKEIHYHYFSLNYNAPIIPVLEALRTNEKEA